MMFTAKQRGRRGHAVPLGLLVAMLLGGVSGSSALAQAEAVTVRAVDRSLVFEAATMVTVEIVVENALGVAGLDFSIDYPALMISTENLSTHTNGGLWGLLIVNHDNSGGDDPPAPGFRRITVSAADAFGRTVESGLLLTLEFEVNCAGYAQDYPDGRDVVLDVRAVNAFDETGALLPSLAVDGTLTLDCTTVGVESNLSFGTIKALYDATTRED